MGARKKESGRVTFMGGSKAAVDVELTLELSGMRDCGGVRERLDALELEPSTVMEISILAVWWSICGVSGWLQVECGGANVNWQNNGGFKHGRNPNPYGTYTAFRFGLLTSIDTTQSMEITFSHLHCAKPWSPPSINYLID